MARLGEASPFNLILITKHLSDARCRQMHSPEKQKPSRCGRAVNREHSSSGVREATRQCLGCGHDLRLGLKKMAPQCLLVVAKQHKTNTKGAIVFTGEPHHKTDFRASTLFAREDEDLYTTRFSNLRRRTSTVAAAAYQCGEEFQKRAARYHQCCEAVAFKEWADNSTGEMKRTYGGGKPCRQRLCPTCQHLKSRVLVTQLGQVHAKHMEKNPDSVGLLLTLTLKNCTPEALRQTIQDMHHSFGKLRRRVEFERSVRAFFRATEVTINDKAGDRTYHPHMHVLLMVPRAYFDRKAGLYITHRQWVQIWQECLGVDYPPIVGISAVTLEAMSKRNGRKGAELTVAGAIREVAKYCVKPDGYQTVQNGRFFTNPDVFSELFHGLRNHRLYAWGGDFDTIRKELELQDVESPEFDLDAAIQEVERPAQNYTHVATIHCRWEKSAWDGRGLYVPVGRLDVATGEFTLLDWRFRGGG